MDGIWKIAFGMAGLGAIVTFVMYKRWLSSRVSGELQPTRTYRLYRLFLVLTFLAAIVGFNVYFVERGRTQRERIHITQSREDSGVRTLMGKRRRAATTQEAQAADWLLHEYRQGMEETKEALRAGEVDRAFESQRRVLIRVNDPHADPLFTTPDDRKRFIDDNVYIPK